jgi:hypothetical protein
LVRAWAPDASPLHRSGRETTDLRLVRVPAADHAPGSMRPVYFVSGWFPRIVDAARAPAYAPEEGAAAMTPLGYIPQVNHTYAYWDLNYGALRRCAALRAWHGCGRRRGVHPQGHSRPVVV